MCYGWCFGVGIDVECEWQIGVYGMVQFSQCLLYVQCGGLFVVLCIEQFCVVVDEFVVWSFVGFYMYGYVMVDLFDQCYVFVCVVLFGFVVYYVVEVQFEIGFYVMCL